MLGAVQLLNGHVPSGQFTPVTETECRDPAVQKNVCGVEVSTPSTATVGPVALVVIVMGISICGAGAL